MTGDSTLSFDRMRGMLLRAAEIRDSEQQQIFDSLDEIHARLAALDTLGSVRKRLGELPDRTEVGVLAERLDEAVAKLDAQDASLAALTRAVEALPDKLGRPIAALDGRLDGMAGRLEGVSGRMDGLDDRLGGLHKRLDDLDNRIDRNEMRLDGLPTALGAPVRERIDGLERAVREQVAGSNPAAALEALTARLDALTARLDALDAAVAQRPDSAAVGELVTRANAELERRNASQLDEAMATFAEIMVGRGAATGPPPAPRATNRRAAPRSKAPSRSANGVVDGSLPLDPDPDPHRDPGRDPDA
jgi:tetrahydromethanopterin S-methyltransferase subunit G